MQRLSLIRARLEFKKEDLWIGAYFKRCDEHGIKSDVDEDPWGWWLRKRLDVWLCLIPMLPIHFVITWGERDMTDSEWLDLEYQDYCDRTN